jgi:hypothetical protein
MAPSSTSAPAFSNINIGNAAAKTIRQTETRVAMPGRGDHLPHGDTCTVVSLMARLAFGKSHAQPVPVMLQPGNTVPVIGDTHLTP